MAMKLVGILFPRLTAKQEKATRESTHHKGLERMPSRKFEVEKMRKKTQSSTLKIAPMINPYIPEERQSGGILLISAFSHLI